MGAMDFLKNVHGRLLEYWILVFILCISAAIGLGQRSLWAGVLTFLGIIAGIAALIGTGAFFGRLGYRGRLRKLRKKLLSPRPSHPV